MDCSGRESHFSGYLSGVRKFYDFRIFVRKLRRQCLNTINCCHHTDLSSNLTEIEYAESSIFHKVSAVALHESHIFADVSYISQTSPA
ncbi:unnamed protein product [Ixodes persulcatus]